MLEVAIVEIEQAHRKESGVPGSCHAKRIVAAAGVGTLLGAGGLAGGPVIGVPTMALGATGGAVLSLLNCAYDLKEAHR
jgi:hypothetical protein